MKFYFLEHKELKPIEYLDECEVSLVSLYYQKSVYTEIAETLLDIDEGFQEWRHRYLKMVERIIGCGKTGTGGTNGCGYLRRTVKTSFYHELWNVRDIFLGWI